MARQKATIRREVISNMTELGVYKKEYNTLIGVFVDMLYHYEHFTEDFEYAGFAVEEEHTNKAGATNMRKTPAYGAMEKMRMDIATYSNLLCLNPKALGSIDIENSKVSKLAGMLSGLEK